MLPGVRLRQAMENGRRAKQVAAAIAIKSVGTSPEGRLR
jgi:hypothetical protein